MPRSNPQGEGAEASQPLEMIPGDESVDDFEAAYGISFEQFIDLDTWKTGPDLPALYGELE
ncbi:MAG: hypothetical protein M3P51_12665, partial [Chloroflexota bacterium]|nr:hypothetical protein [Chloroflexota bacterium]